MHTEDSFLNTINASALCDQMATTGFLLTPQELIITNLLMYSIITVWASQVALVVKNPPANAGDAKNVGLIPGA